MTAPKLYRNFKPARMPDNTETIEGRILTALKTLRALPDPDARVLAQFKGQSVSWPEVVREQGQAYGYGEVRAQPFRPSPKDVSRMLDDLAWPQGIDKPLFRILWWRSHDAPFSIIAARIGRSPETARRRYREAIMEVTRRAVLGDDADGRAEEEAPS